MDCMRLVRNGSVQIQELYKASDMCASFTAIVLCLFDTTGLIF